jgi:hypothetical protein
MASSQAINEDITPQLHDLMNILAEIAPRYADIGTALKVPMASLGLHPLPFYYKDNLRQTLEWWLNNGDSVGSPVTYDTIIDAIGGPIVENYRLAQEIMKIKDTRLLTNERTTNISLEEFPSNVLEPGKVQRSEVRDMLNIGDLDDVIAYLKSNQFVATRWQELGLQLGLYKPTLEVIDEIYRGNPRKCLMECLAAWLKGEDKVMDKGGPSWTSLADALHVIGEHNIAICINSRQ